MLRPHWWRKGLSVAGPFRPGPCCDVGADLKKKDCWPGLGKPDCPQRELPGLAKGAELARSSVPVCGGRGVVLRLGLRLNYLRGGKRRDLAL